LNETDAIQLLGALASGNLTVVESVPGVTPAILTAAATASEAAYQKSFETVYFASIAFGIVAIITAGIVNNKKLNEAMTPEIARRLQGLGEPRKDDEEKM
jgi:xanthine/uracil permease